MVLRGRWSTVHPADASARALMGGGPTEADDARPPAPESIATPAPPADANEQSDTTDDEPQQAHDHAWCPSRLIRRRITGGDPERVSG